MNVLSLVIAIWLACCKIALGDTIDYTVCNPLNSSVVPPPLPVLSESFSTKIEWKWLDTNTTIEVTEIHNGILKMSSQDLSFEGVETQIIYDHGENQYITYNAVTGCTVRGLRNLEFYNNMLWLTSLKMMEGMLKPANPEYIGKTTVRSISAAHWRSCLYLYQSNITVRIDSYFSDNWAMALSLPNQLVPVRIEIYGSTIYNNTNAGRVPFHAVGDFVEYDPTPVLDPVKLQVPAGVFCPGRKSGKPINPFPSSFSVVMETLDLDYARITYESIWFDPNKRLVRRDYKEATGTDPDPTTEIFDLNLGIHYSFDKYMGNCQPVSELKLGDLYVASNGNGYIRMMTAQEFFHVQDTQIQYVGLRTTRGVSCDVWIGLYLNGDTGKNSTIEWYFTQDNWLEGVEGIIQPASLFRMDIWQGGSNKPIVRNIVLLDTETPSQTMFNIAQCFTWTHKLRLLVNFRVVNQASLDTVSLSYLKNTLHMQLVQAAYLSPLSITDVMVQSVGGTDVYLDATLLDSAPLYSTKIQPPAPTQHTLEAAFEFLKGIVGGRLRIIVNSTSDKGPVILETDGIVGINYTQVFTTTMQTTTTTTTQATPPPPEILTTIKQVFPAMATTNPLLTTLELPNCTCPVQTCSTKAVTSSRAITFTSQTISVTSSSPTNTSPSTILQNKCPNITCPQPVTCPAISGCQCPRNISCPKPTQCPTVFTRWFSSSKPPTKCPTVLSTPCSTLASIHVLTNKRTNSPASHSPHISDSAYLTSGEIAGVAVAMVVIGFLIGVLFILIYQRYRHKAEDEQNILEKYLDNEVKY